MDNVLISACLLGLGCRYDGTSKEYNLDSLKEKYNLVPFCPEIYGGLPTPRVPSEVVGDKVINRNGVDVTDQYTKGAEEALRLCKMLNIKLAILKERSPSCGKDVIYDGSFTKTLTKGDGVTAKLLKQGGIAVLGESETEKLF